MFFGSHLSRGSLGVSPHGTVEANPTAPAGRIKPRINNEGTGQLWPGTKKKKKKSPDGDTDELFIPLIVRTFLPLPEPSQISELRCETLGTTVCHQLHLVCLQRLLS